jgi:hypothetical protein
MVKSKLSLVTMILSILGALNTHANTNTWGVCLYTRYQSSNIYHSPAAVAAVRGTLVANETVKADFKEGKWYAVFRPSEAVRSITNAVGYMMEGDLFQTPLPPGPIAGGVGEAPSVAFSMEKMDSIPVVKKNPYSPIPCYSTASQQKTEFQNVIKESRQYYAEPPVKYSPRVVTDHLAAAFKDAPAEIQTPKENSSVAKVTVYTTKISKDENDILVLANGCIVKITGGFLGFVGFQKDAVLFKDGLNWKIWIKGKKVFNCEIIKAPSIAVTENGERFLIEEVKSNGKILKMSGGAIYTVDDFSTFDTTLWMGNVDALLIDGKRLINFTDADAIVEVTKLN